MDLRGYFGVRESWRVFGLWNVVERRTLRTFLECILGKYQRDPVHSYWNEEKTYAFKGSFGCCMSFRLGLASFRAAYVHVRSADFKGLWPQDLNSF